MATHDEKKQDPALPHPHPEKSNPYGLSKNMQALMGIIAVILVISVTALLITGTIRW